MGNKLRYVTLLATMGRQQAGEAVFKEIPAKGEPFYMADYFYTKGKLNAAGGKKAEAIAAYEQAVSLNPYLFPGLCGTGSSVYRRRSAGKSRCIKNKASGLQINPGPAFETPN
jgi:tetratricopeptide (TPR) repeat protein